MNTLEKFFGLYSCRKDNVELLTKVNSVLKSCETKDQYKMAVKYASFAYDRISANVHKDGSFGFAGGYIYLLSMAKAIEADFKIKSKELNVMYLPVLY